MMKLGTTMIGLVLAFPFALAVNPADSTNFTFTTVDVPTSGPTGSLGTELFAINNHGTVVGGSQVETCFVYARNGTYSVCRAPFGDGSSHVKGINDSNDIVGWFGDQSGKLHGYTRIRGNYLRFEPPNAPSALPIKMSNNGHVVGWFKPQGFALQVGFLASNGSLKVIDPVPSESSLRGYVTTEARGVNDRGHVVGYTQHLRGSRYVGFLYVDGAFTTIEVPGASETFAEGINNKGEIVGYYKTPEGKDLRHGFLYRRGAFTRIDVPWGVATWPLGINDSNEIAGGYDDGKRGTGSWHGFIARPSVR